MGAKVSITDVDANACKSRVEELSRSFGSERISAIPADLSDEQQIRRMVREATDRMGGLGILIHCAAYVGTTRVARWAVPFAEQSLDAFEAAMRIAVGSAFVAVQEGFNPLVDSGHGSVIFLGSIYGITGPDLRLYERTSMTTPAGYGASKGGLLQLTRYLATILAPNIRVNSISPGGIQRNQPLSFQERYISRTPLARMATEEDLKGAVTYLASDLSAYVTGHNLVVDGGWTAW
jgi:NAD(P)-dependent dehydrogenase (short-subunit alcohol dehydrogenase family)